MGAVVVSGLGKSYKQYPHRSARLREWLMPWRGPRHTLKRVVEDVSFQARAGESLGVAVEEAVGQGAGRAGGLFGHAGGVRVGEGGDDSNEWLKRG